MRLNDEIEQWILRYALPSNSDPEGAIPVALFRDFVRDHTAVVVKEIVELATSDEGVGAEWINLIQEVSEGMYDKPSLTGDVTSDLRHQRVSTLSGGQQG